MHSTQHITHCDSVKIVVSEAAGGARRPVGSPTADGGASKSCCTGRWRGPCMVSGAHRSQNRAKTPKSGRAGNYASNWTRRQYVRARPAGRSRGGSRDPIVPPERATLCDPIPDRAQETRRAGPQFAQITPNMKLCLKLDMAPICPHAPGRPLSGRAKGSLPSFDKVLLEF